MTITIDLDRVTDHGAVRNLAGKPRGIAARKAFNLDQIDASPDPVVVKVPDYLYAISSSYFLGLFSNSVVKAGSAERFLNHFRFEADPEIMKQVLHGIQRCLVGRAGSSVH